MEIESELTKGEKTDRIIIRCYTEIINEMGTLSCYIGKMQLYFLTSEKCNYSLSRIREALSRYFKGEIRP